jgi:hypothetical protein
MKKVEGGSAGSPKVRISGMKIPRKGNGEGGEAIGVISKGKGKPRKSFGDEEEDTPRKQPKPQAKGDGKGNKTDDSPAGKKPKTDKSNKDETPKKASKSSGSKIEPAELQLPHTIRPDHDTSAENEGLTKMQKDMKAKLEGARFRWINEQLYSTPSTEAVEMMQKDPKIFSDVSSRLHPGTGIQELMSSITLPIEPLLRHGLNPRSHISSPFSPHFQPQQ